MMPRRKQLADGVLSTEKEVTNILKTLTDSPISQRTRRSATRKQAVCHKSRAEEYTEKATASTSHNLCVDEDKIKINSGIKQKSERRQPVLKVTSSSQIQKSDKCFIEQSQTVNRKRKSKKPLDIVIIDSDSSSNSSCSLKFTKKNKHTRSKKRPNYKSGKMLRCESPMEIDDYDVHGLNLTASHIPQPKPDNEEARSTVASSQPALEKEDSLPSNCVVCMCPPNNPKVLDKCKHVFCTECIDQCFAKMNPKCPVCGTAYGDITGNMPVGTMNHYIDSFTVLPGYEGCGAIVIQYNFPDGIQTDKHPHPGQPYWGTSRVAFLPNDDEGKKVLGLLLRSFDAHLTFTVGRSATTGLDDQVIWNDVHHKTRVFGGPTAFGYPDPTYLTRVQEELSAKGIV